MTDEINTDPNLIAQTENDPNQLLTKVADGDQQAFNALYDATSHRVYGLVLRILKDPQQSEEVTQEIFLEIWQQAPKYSEAKGNAIGWMLTITHRRSVDRVRASQASYNRDQKEGAKQIMPEYDQVDETASAHFEHDRIVEALNQLTQVQKECVVLAYYGGYTQTAIAERLSVPLGTVKTRLRDGMIRLRDTLGVTS